MSAFVVSDQTVNKVVTWIGSYTESEFFKRKILRELDIDVSTRKGLETLAKGMMETNIRAVRQRYDDADESGMIADYQGLEWSPCTTIQAYKSLRCWIYQCSEGDVPETSIIYNIMVELSAEIAHRIVTDLPAYDKAAWD